jgi:hypothetical protein
VWSCDPVEAERLGVLEVDDQLEFRRLPDRQILSLLFITNLRWGGRRFGSLVLGKRQIQDDERAGARHLTQIVGPGETLDGVALHFPQSSSASFLTAGDFGFFSLIQSGERPERYGESSRFEMMPS